jgi:hypothetical protein
MYAQAPLRLASSCFVRSPRPPACAALGAKNRNGSQNGSNCRAGGVGRTRAAGRWGRPAMAPRAGRRHGAGRGRGRGRHARRSEGSAPGTGHKTGVTVPRRRTNMIVPGHKTGVTVPGRRTGATAAARAERWAAGGGAGTEKGDHLFALGEGLEEVHEAVRVHLRSRQHARFRGGQPAGAGASGRVGREQARFRGAGPVEPLPCSRGATRSCPTCFARGGTSPAHAGAGGSGGKV